jgi:hypothetical protein
MSATGSGSAKTGLVWWSKLALWTLVLVFGVLYLGSVKRSARVDVPAPAAAPASIPVPEVPPPGGAIGTGPPGPSEPSGRAQEVAAEPISPPSDDQADGAPGPVEAPEPVRAAESAAFADSLLNKATGEEAAGALPAPVAEAPGGRSNATTLPPQGSPVGAADIRAQQTVDEGIGGHGPQAQPKPVRTAPGQESGVPETKEAERARILMEYETMRRSAEERTRQHWPPRRAPGWPVFPHGHPVYGPWGYPTR